MKTFLDALSVVATSPYALVGYVVLVIFWGVSLWNTQKLKLISERLKDLPEKDRLKALQLEYRLIPKEGLDSKAFLELKAKQYKLSIILALVLAVLLIACLSTYRALEGEKQSSAISSMSLALKITKMGKTSADHQHLSIAAGNLEAALSLHPSEIGYMNLGYIYDEISNIDAAIIAYKKANEINPSISDVHIALGNLYSNSGQYELALKHLEKARSLSTSGDDEWLMATASTGIVLWEIGRQTNDTAKRSIQCEKAIKEYLLPALKYRGAIKDQDLVASALSTLGNCYKDTNQLVEARQVTEEALMIKRRIHASRSLANTLVNMADLFLKEERFEEAKPYLIEASSIFEILQNHFGIGAAYCNLGDIMWAEGNEAQAKKYYEQSLEAFLIARAGGEYEQSPRRRLERMRNRDIPPFVKRHQNT